MPIPRKDQPEIRLVADKVKVHGPKVDGGYTVSFDIGEYEQSNVAQLLLLKQNEIISLTIGSDSEKSD